jgi:hypothetical protein
VDPSQDYTLYSGFVHLGAGLSCGFTGMAAGYAIGIVGDSVRLMSKSSEAMLNMVHAVRPCLRPRIKGICDDGSNPHLRRGTGLVRVRAPCCGAASESSLKVGPWQAHRCIDYEHENIRCSLFMTFTTTSVHSYKTTSVDLIVALRTVPRTLCREWLQGIL